MHYRKAAAAMWGKRVRDPAIASYHRQPVQSGCMAAWGAQMTPRRWHSSLRNRDSLSTRTGSRRCSRNNQPATTSRNSKSWMRSERGPTSIPSRHSGRSTGSGIDSHDFGFWRNRSEQGSKQPRIIYASFYSDFFSSLLILCSGRELIKWIK